MHGDFHDANQQREPFASLASLRPESDHLFDTFFRREFRLAGAHGHWTPRFDLVERGAGAFRRIALLPVTVDADKVKAYHEGGVLEVLLPKKAKPTRILISNGK